MHRAWPLAAVIWRCLFSSKDSSTFQKAPFVCQADSEASPGLRALHFWVNLIQFARTLFSTSNKVLQSTAAYVFVDGSVAEEASNPLCLVWACVTLDEQ